MKNGKQLFLTIFLAALLLSAALVTLPQVDVSAAPRLARTTANVIFGYGPQTVALTGTQTITPERTLILLAPDTAVLTMTLATGGALPGDQLLVINTVATNTVVLTTGTTLTSNLTLAERDGVKFTYADGVWVDEYSFDN